jgi:hypothetical protein
MMASKELTAFRMDRDLMEGMRRVKDRDGIPLSVQIHRAVEHWLVSKGVGIKKTAPRRAVTRRKA